MTEKRTTDASAAERAAVQPRDLELDNLGMDGLLIVDSDHRLVHASPAACELLGYTVDQLRTCDFSTSIPRPFATCPDAEPVRWTVAIPRSDGSELDVECAATNLNFGGEQLIAVSVRNVSERRRQAREAAALAQEAARAGTSDGIETTLRALAEGALSSTRALGAAVWLDQEEEGRPVWIGEAGLPEGFRQSLREAMLPSRLAADQTAGDPRVVAYPDARRRLESNPARWAGLTQALEPLPWQAAVLAPIIYLRQKVGMLMAVYATGTLPSEEETTFLATLADQAALAAARLIAAGQERPAAEERQPLEARELQDSVCQSLYGIALGARTAHDLLERDPARLSETIEYILQLAAAGLAELRASSFEVRPEALETEGLVTALNNLIEAVRVRYGIAAEPILCAEPDSSPTVKQALYHIALGAFRNVVKHTCAGRVDARLEAHGGHLVLEVEDDGIGSEPDGTCSWNPGLRCMRDRAKGVGGSLEVVRIPGRGTRIRVCVPSRSIIELRGIQLVNGVHDMGGSHGHGPIVIEPSEPVFHADWERKVWAMMRLCLRQGLFNVDEMRHAIERMEPADYLRASYYERWMTAMETLLREKGVAGEGPIRPSGRNPTCEVPPTPRFKPGDTVRTRNLNRPGHTRLPGYARHRRGVVEEVYAPALLPDTNVGPKSRDWQPVYLVRFDSRELWGEQGRDRETVSSSLFESYLEPEAS